MSRSIGLDRWFGGLRMRAYQSDVEYSFDEFIHPDALYLADEQYVVTIVKADPKHVGEYWPQLHWILPAEVRLLASIALALPEGRGALSFHPYPSSDRLSLPLALDLSRGDVVEHLRKKAQSASRDLFALRGADHILGDRRALFQNITVDDGILVRGLYCLLKSRHLMSHQQFAEEAFMNVQIAREAALELIRETMVKDGESLPSYAAAHDYIRVRFLLGGYLADYLEDQHNRWIYTRHPRSRHGTFWNPPLLADDFYETYEALVSVFRHLLLGEPGRITALL